MKDRDLTQMDLDIKCNATQRLMISLLIPESMSNAEEQYVNAAYNHLHTSPVATLPNKQADMICLLYAKYIVKRNNKRMDKENERYSDSKGRSCKLTER